MAQKQLSMKEIAQLAGVSVATVSHVVNNVGRFSEDTRKRVQDVIDQYGYVTNQSAKTLRQAQSRSIGMIVPDISNDFFSKIAYHVERTLAAQGTLSLSATAATIRSASAITSIALPASRPTASYASRACVSSRTTSSRAVSPWSASTACRSRTSPSPRGDR